MPVMTELDHRILVTGSTAIDQTGFYPGSFREYQDRYSIDAFNMSFQLGGMKTSFGGCGPNIAYGLAQLGASEPLKRVITGAVIIIAAVIDGWRTAGPGGPAAIFKRLLKR